MGVKYLRYFGTIVVVLTTLIISLPAAALDVPPAPPLSKPIVDQTNTLSAQQQENLAAIIAGERTKSSNEIGILLINSLDGESISDYSVKVFRQWGIGTKAHDNGVLLLVAIKDHQLWITTGYGLEGALPDARASQIIRSDITPYFKQNQYYDGIEKGLMSIIASIHGEYKAADSNMSKPAKLEAWFFLVAWLIVPFLWVTAILARSKSWWAGGVLGGAVGGILWLIFGTVVGIIGVGALIPLGLLLDFFVSRNYKAHKSSGTSPSWWAGGSGSSWGSGGGSFGGSSGGSFGGGSTGGGGAGGSW